MAQFKLNLQFIKQCITFIMTAGNLLITFIENIERTLPNG